MIRENIETYLTNAGILATAHRERDTWTITTHPVVPQTRIIVNGFITQAPSDAIDAFEEADAQDFSEKLSKEPTKSEVLTVAMRLQAKLVAARTTRLEDYRRQCQGVLDQALALASRPGYRDGWSDVLSAADLDFTELPSSRSLFPLLVVDGEGIPQKVTQLVPWSAEQITILAPSHKD